VHLFFSLQSLEPILLEETFSIIQLPLLSHECGPLVTDLLEVSIPEGGLPPDASEFLWKVFLQLKESIGRERVNACRVLRVLLSLLCLVDLGCFHRPA